MSKSVYIPLCDNGMGLSRTAWAFSLLSSALTVLRDYSVTSSVTSFPYPDGMMEIVTDAFLKSDSERMIVIDTDVVFTPRDLGMLLEHEEPLVFGLYPKKEPGLSYPVIPLDGDASPFEDDGRPDLREVKCCAKGFMNVHRSVFEALRDHVGTAFNEQTKCETSLFWSKLTSGHSEDFAFCNLYRSIGGKVLVDKRICCRHEGTASYPIVGTY